MTFKLNPNPTFKAKVALSAPGCAAAEVTFEFKHFSRSAMKEFFSRLAKEQEGDAARSDADALAEIVVGWGAEIDEKFSQKTLALLVDNYPAATREIFEAFRRELLETRAKN